MATCEVCGNDYDKAFELRQGDETHVFDSFSVLSMRSRRRVPTAAAA